jgi:hypothetical protein
MPVAFVWDVKEPALREPLPGGRPSPPPLIHGGETTFTQRLALIVGIVTRKIPLGGKDRIFWPRAAEIVLEILGSRTAFVRAPA